MLQRGEVPKVAAKKGLLKMKQLQLAARQKQKQRKGGAGKILQLADPDADPDVVLVVKEGSITADGCILTLVTPNTELKVRVFAMEDKEDKDKNTDNNNDNPTDSPELLIPPQDMLENGTIESIQGWHGVRTATEKVLNDRDDEHEVVIGGLKPGRHYKLFAFLVCCTNSPEPDDRTFRKMKIEECLDSSELVLTGPEDVELGWDELTIEEQQEEVRAACRTSYVIAMAAASEKPITLPTDEDFILSKETSISGRAANKKIDLFYKWWVPGGQVGMSASRRQLLFREVLYAIADDDVFKQYTTVMGDRLLPADAVLLKTKAKEVEDEREVRSIEGTVLSNDNEGDDNNNNNNVYKLFFNFRSWYKGGQVLMDIEEEDFLEKQKQAQATSLSGDSGSGAASFVSATGQGQGQEQEQGQASVSSDSGADADAGGVANGSNSGPNAGPNAGSNAGDGGGGVGTGGSVSGSISSQDPGVGTGIGLVGVDRSLEMSDEDISVEGDIIDLGAVFIPLLPVIRKSDRGAFLRKAYTENVDRPSKTTKELMEIFKIAEKSGLSEKDLTLRRAKLSDEDIDVIMASIKLFELCVTSELISKGKRLDSSLLGKGVYIAQNICKADIFHPINESMLIPDKPPQLILACLPGTNRRPIRPWQVCTPEEQNLELSFACSLEYILETALMEGMAVRAPRDCRVRSGRVRSGTVLIVDN